MTHIDLQNLTDRELLIQAITVMNALSTKVETMASDGLPRCAEHQQHVAGLSKKVGRFTKAAYACGLIIVADLVAKVAWK